MNKQKEMDNKVMMMIQVLLMLQLDEENYHQLLNKINSREKSIFHLFIYLFLILTLGSNLKLSPKQLDFDH